MLFNGKRKFFLTLLAAVFCTGLNMNAMSKEYSVCIDPGHQGSWVDMSAPESIAPGSDQTKAKCTTGTTGKTTGVPEYQLNLDISLKRFATVFPACGSANSAIELTIDELERHSAAVGWVDVCKNWR